MYRFKVHVVQLVMLSCVFALTFTQRKCFLQVLEVRNAMEDLFTLECRQLQLAQIFPWAESHDHQSKKIEGHSKWRISVGGRTDTHIQPSIHSCTVAAEKHPIGHVINTGNRRKIRSNFYKNQGAPFLGHFTNVLTSNA